MHCSSPTSQASLFVIVVSILKSNNDLCHNCQMLWHIWEVPIDVPCRQCNMMLRWWVLVRLLWLATWHRGIVFVWLVCRQWQLGRALSVEMRYGGGLWPFGGPCYLLTSQALLFIVVVVAVDSNSSLWCCLCWGCCHQCVLGWLCAVERWLQVVALSGDDDAVDDGVENGCCVSINKVMHY